MPTLDPVRIIFFDVPLIKKTTTIVQFPFLSPLPRYKQLDYSYVPNVPVPPRPTPPPDTSPAFLQTGLNAKMREIS